MHTQLDDPSDHGNPLEELTGTDEEKDAAYLKQLKSWDAATADTKRALILKVSHIGGHKFSGNVIVCLPYSLSFLPVSLLLFISMFPQQIYLKLDHPKY